MTSLGGRPHRAKHQAGWTLRRHPLGQCDWTSPAGIEYRTTPADYHWMRGPAPPPDTSHPPDRPDPPDTSHPPDTDTGDPPDTADPPDTGDPPDTADPPDTGDPPGPADTCESPSRTRDDPCPPDADDPDPPPF